MPLSAHPPEPSATASRSQHRSLGWRMALLVAGTTLPLIIFSAGVVYFDHVQKREAAFERVLDRVRGIQQIMDTEMGGIVHGLEVLAGTNALVRGDMQAFRSNAAGFLKRYPTATGLALSQRDGIQVFNSRSQTTAQLPKRSGMDELEEVFRTRRPAFSNLFVGNVSGQRIITVSVPVFREDAVVYELAFSVPLDKFLEIIERQRRDDPWTIAIFDRNGTNFARIPNPEQTFGQKASPTLLPALLSQSEGKLSTTSLEGVPLLTAFTRSPLTGWTVAAGTPIAALTAPLWRDLIVSMGIGLIMLAIGLLFAVRMATQIARGETLLALMINEVNHRVKNMFATVQAIAAQTFRHTSEPADAARKFDARLQALARTHDVLGGENWQSAQMEDIVREALQPFSAPGHKMEFSGPPLRLSSRKALMTSLVLHELATNATKYGALSNANGSILVRWNVTPADTVRLVWEEHGGPPVAEPQRKGFGSRLIEQAYAAQLKGRSTLQFKPEGLVCVLECPLK